MKRFIPSILLGLAFSSAAVVTHSATAAIRNFDIKTIESLGRQIYDQDSYAAKATDILFKRVGGPEQLSKEGINGWVVSEKNAKTVIRFLKQENGAPVPAYDITFSSHEHGEFSATQDKDLSPDELAQFKARQLALKNIPQHCSDSYNTVVLPDVGGKGYLVYVLAATTDPNLIHLGGHYRFTVSIDGANIECMDKLSKSCLVIDKRSAGDNAAGLVASHIVSDTPVETHVFVSLISGQPLYIGTADGQMWNIDKGAVTKIYKTSGEDK